MTTLNIKSIIRDALIVYALTFGFGLASAIAGLTVQNSPSTAFMVNLLSGAAGFAMAALRTARSRAEHMAWVAVTFWTLNLTNIVIGLQTYRSWIHSGVTIILMAGLGGVFARILQPLSHSIHTGYRATPTE